MNCRKKKKNYEPPFEGKVPGGGWKREVCIVASMLGTWKMERMMMKAECRWMIWRRSTNRNGVSLSYKDEIQINHVQLDRYKIEERELQKTRLKYVYFYFYVYINLKQKYLNKTLSFNPIIILILTLLTPTTSNYSILTEWK